VARQWIGGVLAEVSAESLRRGEPFLSALCVNPDESVFDGYAAIVGAATGTTPPDPDVHASHERLASYRHFEAAGLPADGGSAMIPPKLGAARARARKAAIAERPINKCPPRQPADPSQRDLRHLRLIAVVTTRRGTVW
jgi:hypothetical protein